MGYNETLFATRLFSYLSWLEKSLHAHAAISPGSLDQPMAQGVNHRRNFGMHVELAVDVPHIKSHCAQRYAQHVGDGLKTVPIGQQLTWRV